MPRGNIDYQKGVIYTIKTGDSVYVGSTTDFRNRKYQHKSNITKKKGIKLYQNIIKNNSEWDMKPYKLFPCNSKLELEIEEEKIRRELKCDLNMIKCYESDEERKQRRKKSHKEWCDNNTEHLKNIVKDYYEKNKEKILNQKKKYREKNRETLRQQKSEKVICECGCCVSRGMLTKHKKSKKHQKLMLSNNT
tara:strand:+ start:14 stop:589 length:576 start_codon:yes stop_codon:yes gene_type:complete